MTHLCVPITASDPETMLADARAAVDAGADVLELRLDYLLPLDASRVATLVREVVALERPVIATCRIAVEGGRFTGDEKLRIEVYEEALRAGVDCIDVELQAWDRSAPLREHLWAALDQTSGQPRRLFEDGAGHILSQHDFENTPDRFEPILGAMLATPVDILKVAFKANSIIDSIRVLDALYQWRNVMPTIALAMGETGILARVLAKKLGAFLTFASLEEGKESAPGQPTIQQMKTLYRWDKLNERTKVYGVVGCPVAHSMSPAIHNAAFDETQFDGIYLPLRIEPAYEDFKAALDAFLSRPWIDLHGLSVTIPHKENLLRYVREHIERNGPESGSIEPLTARIGVANTLVIDPVSPPLNKSQTRRGGGGLEGVGKAEDAGSEPSGARNALVTLERSEGGSDDSASPQSEIGNQKSEINPHFAIRIPHLSVSNTDYAGALDALCTGMKITRANLNDMRIAVLGAGGASRAIIAGLRDCGAIVYIYNRTSTKARALAAEFGCIAMPWESRELIDTEVIINCTSIGMWPEVDATPLERGCIPPNSIVFDTVYNPIETRLLKDARRRGCQTIDGVAMFVNQAALQFKLWTGIEPPIDVMRGVVIRRLSETRR